MAYTAATQLPTLYLGQIAKPDSVPTLATPIDASGTTLVFTYPITDYTGTVVTDALIIGITTNGYTENIRIPASGLSADGKTATGCVRGIRLNGLDLTTGDTALATSHEQGDPVWNAVSGVYMSLLQGSMDGTVATGGTSIRTGDETDVDVNWIVGNGDTNEPYFGYDSGTNQFIYSSIIIWIFFIF